MIDADHLYAADCKWWHWHIKDINIGFSGKKWSCEPLLNTGKSHTNWNTHDPEEWGINVLKCNVRAHGLSMEQGVVNSGGNSGYQAINFWFLLGATRFILLGFDLTNHSGQSHFFGDHPKGFNHSKPDRFIPEFRTIKGFNILNCSRVTALDAFPRHNLEDVF